MQSLITRNDSLYSTYIRRIVSKLVGPPVKKAQYRARINWAVEWYRVEWWCWGITHWVYDNASRFLSLAAAIPREFLITVDFNLHLDNPDDFQVKQFLYALDATNLTQHVSFPAHQNLHTWHLTATSTSLTSCYRSLACLSIWSFSFFLYADYFTYFKSLLKITDRSSTHYAPALWNSLPNELRYPVCHTSSTNLSCSTNHLLALSVSQFYSWLKTRLFQSLHRRSSGSFDLVKTHIFTSQWLPLYHSYPFLEWVLLSCRR